mmetsp:Transcript_6697/g.14258  ORF Transcript_6697/g.14258 Transcript_6697/m.14258 type:complete len:243 (-) Transcript_6697:1130-1858(-)
MPTTKSTRRITVAVLLPMTTMAIAATLPLRGNRNSKSKNRRKRKRRNFTCFPNPTIPKRPRTRTLRHPVPGIPPTLTSSSTDRSTAIRCKWWRPLLRAGSVAATISIQIRVAAIPASRRNEGSSTWETTTTTTTPRRRTTTRVPTEEATTSSSSRTTSGSPWIPKADFEAVEAGPPPARLSISAPSPPLPRAVAPSPVPVPLPRPTARPRPRRRVAAVPRVSPSSRSAPRRLERGGTVPPSS